MQTGVAVTTAAVSIRFGAASAGEASGGDVADESLFTVVCENNSPVGTAFGAEASARKASVSAFCGDIAAVWMNRIEAHWKRRPAAIAGLTSGGPLFCLEYLARDYAMRLVYRIEHRISADGRTHHALTGPSQLAGWVDRLAAAEDRWPASAAALATEYGARLRPGTPIPLLDLAQRPAGKTQTLFSWVIAPAPRHFFGASRTGVIPISGRRARSPS